MCSQTILCKHSGRGAKYEATSWAEIYRENMPQDFTIGKWTDIPISFKARMKVASDNGGGWVNAGPVTGIYNDAGAYNEWPLRCASQAAWGCQKKIKLRYVHAPCHALCHPLRPWMQPSI